MNIRFRIASAEDRTFLRKLNRLAYEDVVVRQFGSWDDNAQRQRFDSKLQRAELRIVETEGQPIAAIWSSEQEDHIFLHELLVLPEFQNKGIGSQILRWEIDRVEPSKKPIRIHTLVLNSAQEFYKRHGFKEIGRSEIYVDMERAG